MDALKTFIYKILFETFNKKRKKSNWLKFF